MKKIVFFNQKSRVGRTSLVYHIAWMFADRGIPTLAIDLDPQSDLTSMLLDDERLLEIWEGNHAETVSGVFESILNQKGSCFDTPVEKINDSLGLICGDPALSRLEDRLAENWYHCLSGEEDAYRIMTAFHRLLTHGTAKINADVALIDVGPNLGAINRAIILAADQVIFPVAPDFFSMQGLQNLGPTLREWQTGWEKRVQKAPRQLGSSLPEGQIHPAGYIILQPNARETRITKAYHRWIELIPSIYRESVLDERTSDSFPKVKEDPYNLSIIRYYPGLMPLALEARKPMFFLKVADGAIGAQLEAAKSCYHDFLLLARRIASGVGLGSPS